METIHLWQNSYNLERCSRRMAHKTVLFNENIQNNCLPEDLRFFRNGRKRVLQLDDNPKEQWIKSVKRARLKIGEKSNQRSRKRDNDLMSYMNKE